MKVAMGDKNPRYKSENIIDLELDMPRRTTQDYSDLQNQISGAYAQDYQEQYYDPSYMDPRMQGQYR